MTGPLPGDFGVVATYGNLLDREAAKVIRWDTESHYNHAVLCKDADTLIEAAPGGAREAAMSEYTSTVWSTGNIDLTDAQRAAILTAAAGYVTARVGYGYLDIVAIAFEQRRWHDGHDAPHDFEILARMSDMHRLICSQLVDAAYLAAGVHLFDDGRPTGLVSPGDLARLIGTS